MSFFVVFLPRQPMPPSSGKAEVIKYGKKMGLLPGSIVATCFISPKTNRKLIKRLHEKKFYVSNFLDTFDRNIFRKSQIGVAEKSSSDNV